MNTNSLLSHPDRLLRDHLHEVNTATGFILQRHPSGPFSSLGLNVEQVLRALSGWHDVAKGTAFFQDYIEDTDDFARRERAGDPLARSELKRHTPLGSFLALYHWLEAGDALLTKNLDYPEIDLGLVALLVALAVRGHHSGMPSANKLRDGMKQSELPEQLSRLHKTVEGCHPSLAGAIAPLLEMDFDDLQFEVLDALSSAFKDMEKKPLEQRVRYRLASQFCFSCLLEADKALLVHDDLAEYLGRPGRTLTATTVEEHPPESAGERPIDEQRTHALGQVVSEATTADLDDLRPRTLTLPTGLGKTRCAAAWAFHWRGRLEASGLPRPKLFVVLPFLSVIEQTARVYRKELLDLSDQDIHNDPTLLVSHSLSARDYADLEEPAAAEFALDTWRSDIILTTFDQFLLTLMESRARYQQRFHNLCDALVVIDEVQALPCSLWHPVGALLSELATAGRTRLLLMTATQPGLISPPKAVPVIEQPAAYAQARYRLEWNLIPRSLDNWLTDLTEEIDRPENAGVRKWLVVLNTRKSAQTVFKHCRKTFPASNVFLLSSDIVPRDRLARIAAIEQCESCIAVTTQCVESGVDLDMDRVFRDFSTLDSLVQVAGRCNRHGLRERAGVQVVYLTNPEDRDRPFCSYIYDGTLLDATREVLAQFSEQGSLLEEELGAVVEEYFRRLHGYMDTGACVTERWANFDHDELRVSHLLRGYQDQVSFVVGKLDAGLHQEVERAMGIKNRWDRRRALRHLAPRISLVTVSAWKSPDYSPDNIAEALPVDWRSRGWDEPTFWFLDDAAYNSEVGFSPESVPGTTIC